MRHRTHIMVISDGPNSGTGFGEEIRNIFFRLAQTGEFEITWHSLTNMGYPIMLPDVVFPDLPHKGVTIRVVGNRGAGEARGAMTFPKHYLRYNPEAVFFMGDPLNIAPYVDGPYFWKQKFGFPFIFYCTLDGLPFNPKWKKYLEQVNVLIAMTEWAQLEFVKQDLAPAAIHHGVNWNWWTNNPQIKAKLKEGYGIPEDTTLFINWDIAQHRKRTDALLRCWKAFKPESKKAKLLLYTDWQMGEKLGWDIPNLIKQYNVPRDTIISPKELTGIPKFWEVSETPDTLRRIARLGDAYVSTTSGEGFGSCGLQAMSLGMPVIITDYAASSEVHQKGSILVPITGTYRLDDKRRGVEAGLVDEKKFTEAMLYLYNNVEERRALGKKARKWAREFDYDTKIIPQWLHIFHSVNLDEIMVRELQL